MIGLYYYGGDGWGRERNGEFKIFYSEDGADKTKVFSEVTEAKKFYDSLFCDKAAWDEWRGELLEAHTTTPPDNDNDELPL